MKYFIAVLLSALSLLAVPKTPALTKTVAPKVSVVQPTAKLKAHAVTTTQTVQPQPETVSPLITVAKPATETYASGCMTYDSIFRQYAWNVSVAEAICQAESGGNPYATSPPNYDGLSDFGLMQIHGEEIYNPSANIARAYQKYESQGWYAWTTYKTGSYVSFL